MELHLERGRIRAVLPSPAAVVIRTETDTFQYPGACILPGFVDNHVHVMGLGSRLTLPSLHRCRSAQDCVDVLLAHETDAEWVHGIGWDQEDEATYPTLDLLDVAFGDRPVVATRIDGHAMWVNSAALRRAGIEDVKSILTDAEMEPIWAAMPTLSREEIATRILAAGAEFSSCGITEVHDMDVAPHIVEVMRELAESGRLPIRVQSFVSGQHDEWAHAGLLPAGGEIQRTAGIKIYSDGALGSRGAALLAPYHDTAHRGDLFLTVERIVEVARAAIDAGWWCMATHAIGDAAVRLVLDAYEIVRSWDDGKDILLRIEHAQHVDMADVDRFRELGVFACVQPLHCIDDAVMAEKRLGPERLPAAYRWRSLLDAGAFVAAGSDAPIASCSALAGMEAFVRRIPKNMDGPWMSHEVLTVEEAIEAFTTTAHRSADMDYRRGRLDVGMDADLVILERDPRSVAPEEIGSIRVLATFMAGQLRYQV
jgi:predicted amidohydrolase YtcJ